MVILEAIMTFGILIGVPIFAMILIYLGISDEKKKRDFKMEAFFAILSISVAGVLVVLSNYSN